MSDTAILKVNGKEIELPTFRGSEDELSIDISKLRGQTGVITLDNGYANTGATKSAITYLDGEKGILRYRGYNIDDLCEYSRFIEVSYLLINGELPTADELEAFEQGVKIHTMVHEDIRRFYDAWPSSAHPMALLSSAISGISTFYQDSLDPFDANLVDLSIQRLMAKGPTLAAWAHKKSIGQPFVYPNNSLTYSGNFLNMMFSVPAEEYELDPLMDRALNQLLILHADHEQNCSTSTVRIVGSSHASLFSSVAAGVLALSGPLHGGANQKVLEMLQQIADDGGNYKKYVEKAKDKNDPFRLMGFGHRVYKNFDPRARLIKKTCDEILNKLGIHDPLLDIAMKLEEIALSDPYFIEKKLYPNVDFYSGIIYSAMGFPTDMFTVLFAIGRMPGWIAQWKEMIESGETKIGRPRQIYTGKKERPFVHTNKR